MSPLFEDALVELLALGTVGAMLTIFLGVVTAVVTAVGIGVAQLMGVL